MSEVEEIVFEEKEGDLGEDQTLEKVEEVEEGQKYTNPDLSGFPIEKKGGPAQVVISDKETSPKKEVPVNFHRGRIPTTPMVGGVKDAGASTPISVFQKKDHLT